MGDSANREPPACIRNDILVYQNRCLTRIIRALRRDKVVECSVQNNNDETFLPKGTISQETIIEELKNELTRAYCKLDRATVALLNFRGDSVIPKPAETNLSSPGEQECRVTSNGDLLELENLRLEVVGLRSAGAIIAALDGSVSERSATDISVAKIQEELDFWKNRSISTEAEIHSMRMAISQRFVTIAQTVALNAETYLAEVESMAEELARLQQEIQKLNGVIALMNATKTDNILNKSENIILRMDDLDIPVQELHDKIKDLTISLKHCNEKIRVKEELASRILAQHVQLQHLVNSLEQENAILRNESDTFHLALGDISAKLSNGYAEMMRNVGLADKIEEEFDYVTALKAKLLQDLESVSRHSLEQDALRQQSQTAWLKLQEQFLFSLQNGSRMRPNQEADGGGLGGSYDSLVQRELDEVRAKIKCSLCQSRNKSVVLTVCMHCFCRECVDEKMLNARNRKCPLCMQRFADADVRDVHFLNA